MSFNLWQLRDILPSQGFSRNESGELFVNLVGLERLANIKLCIVGRVRYNIQGSRRLGWIQKAWCTVTYDGIDYYKEMVMERGKGAPVKIYSQLIREQVKCQAIREALNVECTAFEEQEDYKPDVTANQHRKRLPDERAVVGNWRDYRKSLLHLYGIDLYTEGFKNMHKHFDTMVKFRRVFGIPVKAFEETERLGSQTWLRIYTIDRVDRNNRKKHPLIDKLLKKYSNRKDGDIYSMLLWLKHNKATEDKWKKNH